MSSRLSTRAAGTAKKVARNSKTGKNALEASLRELLRPHASIFASGGRCERHEHDVRAHATAGAWRVSSTTWGGVPLSYVMVPSDEMSADEPVRFRHTRRGGYGVVSWQVGGVLHVLVGDFSNAELARLAKACVAQWDLPRA